MLPAKIKEPVSDKAKRWVSHAHCTFVRSHHCSACGAGQPIEVAHVRNGSDGGMGRKPSDYYTVSLCRDCHAEQHRVGEASFWKALKIDPLAMAAAFGAASPKSRHIAEHKRRFAI